MNKLNLCWVRARHSFSNNFSISAKTRSSMLSLSSQPWFFSYNWTHTIMEIFCISGKNDGTWSWYGSTFITNFVIICFKSLFRNIWIITTVLSNSVSSKSPPSWSWSSSSSSTISESSSSYSSSWLIASKNPNGSC